MLEYVTNIEPFWKDDLANYEYVRTVPFVAKNFDHLDRNYYNKDHVLQSFEEELPNAQRFRDALDVKEGTVGWICIEPDVILPTHQDTFYTMRQTYNVTIEQCFRYLIFLEDWQFGHYVGFTNKNITNWKAGDVWKFDSTELHYAVNASNLHFHSCQVSTFKL